MKVDYLELIFVEGIDIKTFNEIKIADFELVPMNSLGDSETFRYLLSLYTNVQIRNILGMMNPELICYKRVIKLDKLFPESKELLTGYMDNDIYCIDVILRLLSYKDSNANVIFGVCFDNGEISKGNICSLIYPHINGVDWDNMMEDSVKLKPEEMTRLSNQVYKYMLMTTPDPKKTSMLYQFLGSFFGAPNQRYLSMVIVMDMLRKDTSGNNSKRIQKIVCALLPEENNSIIETNIDSIYGARTLYVHQGDSSNIGVNFDCAYELMVKIVQKILRDDVNMATLEDEVDQGKLFQKKCWE